MKVEAKLTQCPVHLPKTVLEVRSYLDSASTLLQVVLETIGVHVPLNERHHVSDLETHRLQ